MSAFQPSPELIRQAQLVVSRVKAEIKGRVADEYANTSLVACAAAMSGSGDHLEIGTLFGGSAIVVALLKQWMGLDGIVVCVDPLEGYYKGTQWACAVDPVTNLPIDLNTVLWNADHFGVQDRIKVVRARSHPWPEELKSRDFASAYIDGDHWGDGPIRDWHNVHPLTCGYVVFDNCDKKHPAVQSACDCAAHTPNWEEVYRGGISCIVRRVR